MSVLKIGLLGTFDVRYADQPVTGLDARKAQELLAYLLLQRSRAHSREFLAEMLWGQRAPAQSKKYLRQTLWQVQSALTSAGRTGASPLLVDGEWVRVNESTQLQLDVALFESAYDRAQGIPGSDLDDAHAADLRRAVEVYRGDLLEGCYEDWCLFERERLQNMYLAMLDKLIDCCQTHGQFERGLSYGDRILRLDRARERTHRRMMRLYYLAGDRTSALRQFDQLERALQEELEVTPSRSSLTLRDQIRTESFDGAQPVASSVLQGQYKAQRSATPGDARLQLRHLHACLKNMQRQISHEIESIEWALAEAHDIA